MKNIYKSLCLVAIFVALFSFTGLSQNAWINEIHYDNASTDVNEFIEVVIENAGSYSLADFSVILYNGNNGESYNTKTLDVFTSGAVSGNFSFFYYVYPVNGIQNGAPDGMALAYMGNLIAGQWLSYEGTFSAVDGPANGLLSVDIGVLEAGTEPAGNSLQLTGTGTVYAAFSWEPPAAETPGQLNNGQSFGGAPLPEPSNYPTAFTSTPDNITINLTWTDATGTQLPSKYLIKVSDLDNITAPADGTPVADDLNLSDGAGAVNVNYGVETYTFYHLDGESEYFFKIYPYTNAGTAIDYKTDGTAPSTSATTEPVILMEGFDENSFGAWTTYTVASDKDWGVVNFGGALSTTYFAQMNGFGESEPSNDWLISPSMNLDLFGDEKMIFYTQWKYGDTDTELKLMYSTNFTGGDPTLASWTELSFNKSTVQDIWTYSGDVSLAAVTGSNVHVAFQYLSSGNPRRWGVDEIVITGGVAGPFIAVTSPVAGNIWEQGTQHDITWTASNTLANVKIELTTDASSGNPTWTTLLASIPADAGTWTWLISPTQTTSDDCQVRITDIAADAFGLSGIFSIIEPIYIPQLVITEIMYNPPETGTDSLEFIELYNNDNVSIDLEGYYFPAGVTFTFPAITLAPGEYFLVAIDSVAFQQAFGMMAYQFVGALGNNGEIVSISNSYGMLVDSVNYDDVEPWPTSPDGNGPSLAFCDPGLDNSLGENWSASIELAAINSNGDSIFASPGTGCSSWPVADFTADNTIVLTGGSVNFTDLSTGEPDYWVWTFIGGTPGAYVGQTPPPIAYNTPGTYNVSLFISNAAGTNTKEKINYINVGDAPVADFSGAPLTIFQFETVDFTDLSTGTIDTWSWEFEEGVPATSDLQNPSGIQYPIIGLYSVTLTVTNMFGSDVITKEEYIDVLPVGVEELTGAELGIYPNPNTGSFRLISPFNEEMIVSVYNVYGQLVKEEMIVPGDNSLVISEASKGVYIIRYSSQDGKIQKTGRMIIY